MKRVLGLRFFRDDAVTVARNLIGKFLVRKIGRKETALMITETEAYHGFDDKASHGHRGKTKRNAPMFADGGRWYVYFIYGTYWMLNAVTGTADEPSAVLIRGVEGLTGPGKLTKALSIDKRQNDLSISMATGLWIEDRGIRFSKARIGRSPRIRVDYAGAWAKKPFRFFLWD